MAEALWSWSALLAASGGEGDGAPQVPVTGFSIDTRTLKPGDVFVALKDRRDGHDFVTRAFEAGAAAALVRRDYLRHPQDKALLRVADPLEGLEAVARSARARLSSQARVIAVTGSVGKTGTKEMLRACLARLGAVHASEKSHNNLWGVPLTLARLPQTTRFAVLEIGMNHAGEITPLTRLVRPHVAIVTTVAPVHLEFFSSVEEIAAAKSEIFLGLERDGSAVLNRDNPHFDLLAARARSRGATIISFGGHLRAEVRRERLELGPNGSRLLVSVAGRRIEYALNVPGEHIADNSLAVLAALYALDLDLERAAAALAEFEAPPGRGSRTVLRAPGGSILLIDESYNANPASMRAALATLALTPRDRYPRRIAVLGDMLELGAGAAAQHLGLVDVIDAAGVDLVFAAGPNMRLLYDALEPWRRGHWAERSEALARVLVATVGAGDVVMVKGSLGSRMAPLVAALMREHATLTEAERQRAGSTAATEEN
ncbi:MAG TPA: UDP-N-acetylmuramoylalanyl-D-glutamyl-2,6-diaminopimelate--D-alanyl-D-alanine ligase [Hyphomicrobiaceae bacterium]|nr:UDP-N-acetylmuramoylalanyl-D-glutamyl-2,6-diaminopimelate--D-alanyl-D-alanine ligase [Hyphomicrobiaceae bacterium]